MITEKRLKTLEYATALLFLAFFAVLFYQVDYYSAWAIMLLFLLSLAAIFLYADLRAKFYKQQSIVNEPVSPPLSSSPPRKSPEETANEKKAARDLVVKICESKNINLRFKHDAKGGHYDIPETWIIERAVPLDYEDLYAITADEYLVAQTRTGGDGIIYAESFDIYSDWVTYRQEKFER